MQVLAPLCHRLVLLVIVSSFSLSCDPWFSYSPYESRRLDEAYQSLTAKNLELIMAHDTDDRRPFKVAVLSDPHYHYKKLEDAIDLINEKGDYAFAIVTGDLTENGLQQEFVFFHETMSRLKIPYLTVIGNHDYLANGEDVYAKMYGAYNYTFAYNRVKFVLFDNNTIESGKQPDLPWMAEALQDHDLYDHVIPFSHIPPFDIQMKDHQADFHTLLLDNNVTLSIHGHKHEFSVEELYGDGIRYVTASSPQKRTYCELTIRDASLEIKKIEF